jgi:LPS sulfotransferase NodH
MMRSVLAKWFLSPLAGITFGDWLRVLKRCGHGISPRYWPRTAFTTLMSLMNSALAPWEEKEYDADLALVQVTSPIFIIGHERSGTTHLCRLLAIDERFIFPEVTETLFPHTLLTFKHIARNMAEWFSPEKRPQDDVKNAAGFPLEDEWGLCTSTLLSTYMGRYFPHHRDHYKYTLSLKDAAEEEQQHWKKAYHLFAKKLHFQKGSEAILLSKATPNTAKIRLLLDIFPDARFIHIYRNPYRVFQSTLKMEKKSLPFCCYQSMRLEELEHYIIWRYREMYNTFFEDKHLIPEGHFTQLAYEDLVQDRMATVRKIYQDLSLGSFNSMKPDLTTYINDIADYQANSYPALSEHKKRKIADAWHRCFEAFSYPTELQALQV